jgi:signal transduction histidine kinase
VLIYQASSIKRTVTHLVMIITTLLVSVACVIYGYAYYENVQRSQLKRTDHIASIIGRTMVPRILYQEPEAAKNWLESMSLSSMVEHVHLYRTNAETDSLSFFASYYRQGSAPIPVLFDRVRELTTPQLKERYIEFAKPIELDNRILGYVYIRTSRAEIDLAQSLSFQLGIAATLGSLIIAWLMSLWLRRRITHPLNEMVDTIQAIALERNYNVRLSGSKLQELDRLAQAANTLLTRMQQHIKRQTQAEHQASELNTELERQVNQRTTELRESNRELFQALETAHQYQRELVEAEKMSSLGTMVAGMAHEVNTPLGLAITSTSILQDKLVALEAKFKDKKLTSSDFVRYMESFRENIDLVNRNINRTADLMSSFQQLSMDQFSDEERHINVAKFCAEVLQSVQSRHAELEHIKVNIIGPDRLDIRTLPGPFGQIISQLVQNAIQHAFSQVEQPEIWLEFALEIDAEVTPAQTRLFFTYRDNGAGIPSDLGRRVFDPFVTSKRGHGATGLGLHLVYNLVSQVLGGHIAWIESVESGTVFEIRFPVDTTE